MARPQFLGKLITPAQLATIAAITGPRKRPRDAIRTAMRLCVEAAVELEDIWLRHTEELILRYASEADSKRLLAGWRVWHPLHVTPDEPPPKTIRHYPDRQPQNDPAWQWMNHFLGLTGKRNDAVKRVLRGKDAVKVELQKAYVQNGALPPVSKEWLQRFKPAERREIVRSTNQQRKEEQGERVLRFQQEWNSQQRTESGEIYYELDMNYLHSWAGVIASARERQRTDTRARVARHRIKKRGQASAS